MAPLLINRDVTIFPIMSNSTSTDSHRDKRRSQNNHSYDRYTEKTKNTHRVQRSSTDKTSNFEKSGRTTTSKDSMPYRNRTDMTTHADKNGGRRPTERYKALEILKVIAGIVLLFAISWEIITGDHINFSQTYLIIQFIVCLIFLCDFFIRWGLAERRNRFFWKHLPYLLISIPWLNILDWSGVVLTHDWGILVGLIPMLRAFLAMVIVVEWMVSEKGRMDRIFLGLYLHGRSFHLPFGAGILRIRSRNQHEVGRIRQCALVGMDERHDGRRRDFRRHGHRKNRYGIAAVVGHDVLPDLHDLHPQPLHGKEIEISECSKRSVDKKDSLIGCLFQIQYSEFGCFTFSVVLSAGRGFRRAAAPLSRGPEPVQELPLFS